MSQSGFCNTGSPTMPSVPSAPPLEMNVAENDDDDAAPPSYAEATRYMEPPVVEPAPAEEGAASSQGWQADFSAYQPAVDAGYPPPALPPEPQEDPAQQPAARTDVETGDDAPPSYDSMFGRIKEAKESSSGCLDFMSLLLAPLGCLAGLVCVLLVVGLLLGMPITLMIVGSMYMHDCPLEPGIPIWMLVGGNIMLINLGYAVKSKEMGSCVLFLFLMFYLGWYIAGAVLIYPQAWPEYEASWHRGFYCSEVVYMTAFVVLNLWTGIVALSCCAMML